MQAENSGSQDRCRPAADDGEDAGGSGAAGHKAAANMGREGWAPGPKCPSELLLHTSWLGGDGCRLQPSGNTRGRRWKQASVPQQGNAHKNVVHPHNGTLFNLKKNMREPQTLCSLKGKEHKRAHGYASIYRKNAGQRHLT